MLLDEEVELLRADDGDTRRRGGHRVEAARARLDEDQFADDPARADRLDEPIAGGEGDRALEPSSTENIVSPGSPTVNSTSPGARSRTWCALWKRPISVVIGT